MTVDDGPEWASTLDAVKTVPGKGAKSSRIGLQQIQDQQDYVQQRNLAETAVALGAVDTGDDFDGGAYLGDLDVPGIKSDVEVVKGDVRQVQTDQITLAELFKTRRRVPFWVSPNPFEYVSNPRSELGLESGGKPLYTIPAGTLALTTVSIDDDTINNLVRFIAGGDAPPTHLYCGLYSVDQTTGQKTLVWDFGDVRSLVDSGSLTYEVAPLMTEDMVLDGGSIMSLGILPIGGSFKVVGVPRTQIVPDPVIYPQGATELLSGQTALPTTINDSDLDFTSTHRVWGSVGQALPEFITPLTFTLTFDFADTEPWVSPSIATFKSRSDARWRVKDGVLTASGPGSFGSVAFQLGFLVLQRCATSNMFSEFTVGSGWPSDAARASQVYVRGAANGTSAVGLFVAQQGTGNATVTIQLCTSMTAAGTVKATGTDVFSAVIGDTFRIEAIEDETTHITTYTGFRNGVPITGCVWTDTGGLSGNGLSWLRVGFGSRTTELGNTYFRAAGADQVRCGDIT